MFATVSACAHNSTKWKWSLLRCRTRSWYHVHVIIEFGSIFSILYLAPCPPSLLPHGTEEVLLFFLAALAPPTVIKVVSSSVYPWWPSFESLLSEPGRLLSRARRAQSIVCSLSPGGCWEVPASEEDSMLDLFISCITLCGQDMRGSLDSSPLPLESSPCLQPRLRLAWSVSKVSADSASKVTKFTPNSTMAVGRITCSGHVAEVKEPAVVAWLTKQATSNTVGRLSVKLLAFTDTVMFPCKKPPCSCTISRLGKPFVT